MNRKRNIVLEELGIEDEPNEPEVSPETTDYESAAKIVLTRIAANQETGMAIEAMANMLRKETAAALGKPALKLANMAYSSYVSTAKIDLQELPIDVSRYDRSPEDTVAKGIAQIDASKHALFDSIRKELAHLLVINCQQRESLNQRIKGLWSKFHDLSDMVERGSSPLEGAECRLGDLSSNLMLFKGGQLVAGGATVMSDLSHFLTEHTHVFKRLIKKEIGWVADHKENILRTGKGLETFSYTTGDYLCNAAKEIAPEQTDLRPGADETVFVTQELPGMRGLFVQLPRNNVMGLDAFEAHRKVEFFFTDYDIKATNEVRSKIFQGDSRADVYPVLTREEVQARLNEVKRTIKDLEHWADMAYVQMWKDAYFEEEVIAALVKRDAQGLNERMLGDLSYIILQQLNDATQHVGWYGVEVIEAMLSFVEYNLSRGK